MNRLFGVNALRIQPWLKITVFFSGEAFGYQLLKLFFHGRDTRKMPVQKWNRLIHEAFDIRILSGSTARCNSAFEFISDSRVNICFRRRGKKISGGPGARYGVFTP
jgi:hypothetical protein